MYNDHPFDRIRLRDMLLCWLVGSFVLGIFAVSLGGFDEQSPDPVVDNVFLLLGEVWTLAFMMYLGRRGGLHWPSLTGRFPGTQDLKDMSKLAVFMILLALVDIYLVLVALSYLLPTFVEWLMVSDAGLFYLDSNGEPLILANIFTLIYMVVLAPIVEELLFRGFLLHRLCRKYGLNKAIIISAILFGLLHASAFSAFLFGVAMSVVYIRTGSLYVAMLCHALNNLIAWGLAFAFAVFDGDSIAAEYTLSDYREEWFIGAIALLPAIWMATRFVKKPLREVAWQLPDVGGD